MEPTQIYPTGLILPSLFSVIVTLAKLPVYLLGLTSLFIRRVFVDDAASVAIGDVSLVMTSQSEHCLTMFYAMQWCRNSSSPFIFV